MKNPIRALMAVATLLCAAQAQAQVTLYEHDGFQGRSVTTANAIRNLARQGFNDRASSVQVRGERWEVCQDAAFRGRCVVTEIVEPGQVFYPAEDYHQVYHLKHGGSCPLPEL